MTYSKKDESINNHFLNESDAIERIFNHIDNGTTDLGDTTWKEPVSNYYLKRSF